MSPEPGSDLPEPHDDGLWDAVALVEAQLRNDVLAVAVLLRRGNPFNQAVVLSKCLAEVITEQGVSRGHFREWAAQAVGRP